MTTQLRRYFLSRLSQSRTTQSGFTLIELLVVIIIIGILAAIALPSFLNQANKARQSEAKVYIGAMNRAQQMHYLQNRQFADNLADLELGINNTDNYLYTLTGGGDGAFLVQHNATPNGDDLKGIVGTVWLGTDAGGNATTLGKLCEADTPGPGNMPECDPG